MPRALAAALSLLLLALFVPRASAVPPNDIFLFFDRTIDVTQYVNGSTVEAWAALNFSGTPDPPAQVDNVLFSWYAPNGSLAATASIDPDTNGWGVSTHRATVTGTWAVNATYLGTPSLWTNRTFAVLPDTWSGAVVLAGTTTVGTDATLAIALGTTIRSDPGVRVRIKGTLSALGTIGSPIVFTSNASTPAIGDWDTVRFFPSSGNASVLEFVRIQYARTGLHIDGAAPRVTNVSVADAQDAGVRLNGTQVRLTGVDVTRTVNGFWIEGGSVILEDVSAAGCAYGLVALGSAIAIRRATFSNVAQAGLSLAGSAVTLADVQSSGGGVGLRLTDATGTGERLSFSNTNDAVAGFGTADVTFTNSTFGTVVLRHVDLADTARVTVVNGTFPGGERVSVAASARLSLWNWLAIRVKSYDAGGNLSDAAVNVFLDDALAHAFTSDANGTTPTVLLPYRTYAPTLAESRVRIVASIAGYAFADNNRSIVLDRSRTESFWGSTADLDGDGEPDFSDPDVDGDDLDNEAEAILGTNPMDPDTDGDGMPDGWEFDHQLDPKDARDASQDPDGDGLSNGSEWGIRTNPQERDTDGDGMDDGWESEWGFDPNSATDAQADADGDGFTNLEEFLGGTNPRDAREYPSSGLAAVWPFVVALVVAVTIIALSLVIGRRRRARGKRPPTDEGTGST